MQPSGYLSVIIMAYSQVIGRTMQNSNVPTQRVNWRVNDFCDAHGIGRTTFYEQVKRGELRVFKLGDRTLITDAEAKLWQARKMAGAP
jgi:hypothetical protein